MRRLRRLPFVLLGSIALSAYLIDHAFFGRHGLEAQQQLIARSKALERELRSLEAVRADLKADIKALASEPASPDIVSEVAAEVLGWVSPGSVLALEPRYPARL